MHCREGGGAERLCHRAPPHCPPRWGCPPWPTFLRQHPEAALQLAVLRRQAEGQLALAGLQVA